MEQLKENYTPNWWGVDLENDNRIFNLLLIFSTINFFAFSFYAKDFAILRYLRQGLLILFLFHLSNFKKNDFFPSGRLISNLSMIIKFLLFYGVFNIFTGIDLLNSITYAIWLILSVIFIINCIHKLPSVDNFRTFFYSSSKAFYYSGMIIIVVSLIEGFGIGDHRCFDERYVSSGAGFVLQQQFGGIFGNANMLTMLIIIAITSLLVMISYKHSESSSIKKIFDYGVLAGLAALVVYIGCRSGIVCMVIIFILYVGFYLRKPVYLFILAIPIVFYLVQNPEFIISKFRTSQFEDGHIYGNREDLIKDALRITDEMDFFGVGYANQRIARAKYSVYREETSEEEMHFHNTYLALLVEMGYIGFALFCLIIGLVLINAIKSIRKSEEEKSSIIKLLLVITFPIMLIGLSEDSINLPGSPVFVYFWFYFITLAFIIDKK